MKKLIIPCITLILTFILAISVSAESLPALHPAENIQTGVTEQMVAALTKTVPHIRLHPAEKLKTSFSAAYITEHYNICEISHATGETALGETERRLLPLTAERHTKRSAFAHRRSAGRFKR